MDWEIVVFLKRGIGLSAVILSDIEIILEITKNFIKNIEPNMVKVINVYIFFVFTEIVD